MSLPDYVQPGNPLKASWANDVASSLRNSNIYLDKKHIGKTLDVPPFNPISLWYEGGVWHMIIEKGFYYPWTSNDKVDIEIGADSLSDYPELAIPAYKDLYFNWDTKKLEWHDDDIVGNLKILHFEYDMAGDFTIDNLHPKNIDIRKYPPFTPLLAKTTSNYTIGLVPGFVIERIPGQSGGALQIHTPKYIIADGDINFLGITDNKQAAIIVDVDEYGKVPSLSARFVIENLNTDSTHYIPPVADDTTGAKGVYHYPIAKFEGLVLKSVETGHIDHFRDITHLVNTHDPSEEGMGRIIKEYNAADARYKIRVIKEKADPSQIKVIENTDDVTIRGNSLSGKLILNTCGESPTELITWDDGLCTKSGNIEFDVPKYSAGTNISITGTSPCYTISATCSSSAVSGANLNLEIYQSTFSHDIDGHLVIGRATMPEDVLYFRNGILTGIVDPADAPGDLIVKTVDRNSASWF